jgi:hypothetical protein
MISFLFFNCSFVGCVPTLLIRSPADSQLFSDPHSHSSAGSKGTGAGAADSRAGTGMWSELHDLFVIDEDDRVCIGASTSGEEGTIGNSETAGKTVSNGAADSLGVEGAPHAGRLPMVTNGGQFNAAVLNWLEVIV